MVLFEVQIAGRFGLDVGGAVGLLDDAVGVEAAAAGGGRAAGLEGGDVVRFDAAFGLRRDLRVFEYVC